MKGKQKAKEFEGQKYELHIVGRNVMVTEAMKAYAQEKLSKLEKFTTSRIIDVAVTMDIQKLVHRVDILVKVDHTQLLSHASSSDMYASIDQAVDKIEGQLRRYKAKVREHQSEDLATIDLKVNVLRRPKEEELLDVNLDIEEENNRRLVEKYRPHEIVSQETLSLKMLTYDEAIAKMEKTVEPFLLFRNEADLSINAIYRRKDGNYGVVEIATDGRIG
jgi:putative sigma-54 modulation protein